MRKKIDTNVTKRLQLLLKQRPKKQNKFSSLKQGSSLTHILNERFCFQ